RFGVLVVVVVAGAVGLVADRRGDDLARRQARPVVNGDDPDDVVVHLRLAGLVRPADDHRVEPAALGQLPVPRLHGAGLLLVEEVGEAVGAALGHDDERRRVDRVHAFTQDGALPAALPELGLLTRAGQERPRVLEAVAPDHAPERLARRQRLAVAGVHG